MTLLLIAGIFIMIVVVREFYQWAKFNYWLKKEFDKLRDKKNNGSII